MTIPSRARQLGGGLPSVDDRAAADQLRRILASQNTFEHGQKIRVTGEAGTQADIILTAGLSNLLLELLRHVSQGNAVTLVPVSQKLTTQQAADILNVSRPFLISLLEKKEIPYELIGRHRRIQADALFAYKENRDIEREAALSEAAELDAELI